VSRRYTTRQVLAEARQYFENVHVARDFDHFRIVKSEPAQLVDEEGNPVQRRQRPKAPAEG
jgi:hypothetical protein